MVFSFTNMLIISILLFSQPVNAQITLEHTFNESVTFKIGIVNGVANYYTESSTLYPDNSFYTAFVSGNSYRVKVFNSNYSLFMDETYNFTPPTGYKVSSVSMSKKLFNTDNNYEFLVTYSKISPSTYDNTSSHLILYNQNGTIIKDFGTGASFFLSSYLYIINNHFKLQVDRRLYDASNTLQTQSEIYSVPGTPLIINISR